LLRNVLWWGLLPLAIPLLAFFGQVTWQERAGGWWAALFLWAAVALVAVVFAVVYRMNQDVVRAKLEPRRRELEALLMSLEGRTPGL
jgi:hypothetical protein